MILCPTCNNTLDRKHNAYLGEDIIKCRVCRRFTLDGLSVWATAVDLRQLKKLARQRDDDKARWELMMTSSIDDPIWTKLS